jgi:hypothetical protein
MLKVAHLNKIARMAAESGRLENDRRFVDNALPQRAAGAQWVKPG